MFDFSFHNPTRIVFGRGAIAKLADLVPASSRVLLTYGTGSIKRNGVYQQAMQALGGRTVLEFSGIEANPDFATLLRAVELVRRENVDFLLAVGGGSVLDGTKFIAAASLFGGPDPWEILTTQGAVVDKALPLGAVLTLPATGSEANGNSVISRRETKQKLHFSSEHVYPRFSILDPETTYSLPAKQLQNGIADAFVHVTEQYLTYPAQAPLQDRQAEAILATLVEQAPAILSQTPDYQARATFMWSATNALNMLIACGVPQDWATHSIGHELTALYGLDHGESLVIVLPGLLAHQIGNKRAKLEQYGHRIFGVSSAEQAIERTEEFFRSLGLRTRLSECGIDAAEAADRISQRLGKWKMGERRNIDGQAVSAILRSRA